LFRDSLGRLILLDLIDLEYPVTCFYGRPDIVHYIRTGEGLLIIFDMPTFFTGRDVDAYSSKAKMSFLLYLLGRTGLYNLSGGTIEI